MRDSLLIRLGGVLACAAGLSACTTPPPPPVAPPPAPSVVVPAPAPAPVVILLPDPADAAARRLLAYHDQVRLMAPAELANEVNRLNALVSANAAAAPADAVLELALVLSLQHNGGDVVRGVSLLEPIVRSIDPELLPWQPMARLLLGRLNEQRRLEDLVERGNVQRREQQRNLQQLNEKLEALKAIERSMTTRPPGVAPVPAPAASVPQPARAP